MREPPVILLVHDSTVTRRLFRDYKISLRAPCALHSARHRVTPPLRHLSFAFSLLPASSVPLLFLLFFSALRRRNRCGRISGARNHQFRAGKDRSKKESLAPGLLKQTFCSTETRCARAAARVCAREGTRAHPSLPPLCLARHYDQRIDGTFSSCFLCCSLARPRDDASPMRSLREIVKLVVWESRVVCRFADPRARSTVD